MPVSKSTRAHTQQSTTPKGAAKVEAGGNDLASPSKISTDSELNYNSSKSNFKDNNLKSPDSKKHLKEGSDDDHHQNGNKNKRQRKVSSNNASSPTEKNGGVEESPSASSSPTKSSPTTSSVYAVINNVPSVVKDTKKKVLDDLLSKAPLAPVHVKSSIPPSKLASGAPAKSPSSSASRKKAPRSPNSSTGKKTNNVHQTEQPQMSPTSRRILGKVPISKPHKAMVMEIKKIGNYNDVKPKEIVARVQSADIKQSVVSEVANMAKDGLVKLTPSTIVNANSNAKKRKSGPARG